MAPVIDIMDEKANPRASRARLKADCIEGIASKDNLKDWTARAKENSYHPDKAELRRNIGTEGCKGDYESGIPDLPRQKRVEGQGWADMRPTTADNTYTGKSSSKR